MPVSNHIVFNSAPEVTISREGEGVVEECRAFLLGEETGGTPGKGVGVFGSEAFAAQPFPPSVTLTQHHGSVVLGCRECFDGGDGRANLPLGAVIDATVGVEGGHDGIAVVAEVEVLRHLR